MKVSVLTLGCKVNQSESHMIESQLNKYGYSIVSLNDCPDYVVVNTCTVTAKSDYQSRQLIRRSLRSGAKVFVTGCYAQLRPHEIRRIDSNIKIIDNNNKLNVINLLKHGNESNSSYYTKRSRAYLKIQDGCNFTCTYCVVPRARGKSKSLEPSEIINKAVELEGKGYEEIVLTGIHLGLYGYDLNPQVRFYDLLKILLNKTRIARIRVSSLEVNEINEEIIEILDDKRICSHLHVPIQSGDDSILRLMHRRYNVKSYVSAIEKLSKKVRDIAIGTDVIVGFPQEGKREFSNTKIILDSLPLAYMHIFPYSKRPDTVAHKMLGQNTKKVKHERYIELNTLNIKKKKEYMSSFIERYLDIIIEDKGKGDTIVGTSSNYLKVIVPSSLYTRGSLVRVRIACMKNGRLLAYPL